MSRSRWKGCYTSCDFAMIKEYYNNVIPLSKCNIYLFSCFKDIQFEIYNKGLYIQFDSQSIYLGFTIGCFIFSREINVYHNKKKTRKDKVQGRFRKKKLLFGKVLNLKSTKKKKFKILKRLNQQFR